MAQTIPSDDELKFLAWYQKHATKLGLDPDPDNPKHFYDYRAAYKAKAEPDETGHWPSEFKKEGHPNMIVNGINTKTGQPAQSTTPSSEPKKPLPYGTQPASARPPITRWNPPPYAKTDKPEEAWQPPSYAMAGDSEKAPEAPKQEDETGFGFRGFLEPLYKFPKEVHQQIEDEAKQYDLTRTPGQAFADEMRRTVKHAMIGFGESMTSPVSAALSAVGLGELRAVRNVQALQKAGKAAEAAKYAQDVLIPLQKARQVASAPIVYRGGKTALSPSTKDPWERVGGAGEALLGAAGMFGGPFIKTPVEPPPAAPPKPTSHWHPELPPAPEGTPRFFSGEHGVQEGMGSRTIDLGQTPDVFSGTLKPSEFGERVDVPGDITARYGPTPGQGYLVPDINPDINLGVPIPDPQNPVINPATGQPEPGEMRRSPYGQQFGQPGGPIKFPQEPFKKEPSEDPFAGIPMPTEIPHSESQYYPGPEFVPADRAYEETYNRQRTEEARPSTRLDELQERFSQPLPEVPGPSSEQPQYLPRYDPFDYGKKVGPGQPQDRFFKEPSDESEVPEPIPSEHDAQWEKDYTELVNNGNIDPNITSLEKYKSDAAQFPHPDDLYFEYATGKRGISRLGKYTSNKLGGQLPAGAEEAPPFISDAHITREMAKESEIPLWSVKGQHSPWSDVFGQPEELNLAEDVRNVAEEMPDRIGSQRRAENIYPWTELPPPDLSQLPKANLPSPEVVSGQVPYRIPQDQIGGDVLPQPPESPFSGVMGPWESPRRKVPPPNDNEVVAKFRSGMSPAPSWKATRFLLPDGTRLAHNWDTHETAAEQAGSDLDEAFDNGIVRISYNFDGAEIGGKITEAQANALADAPYYTGRSLRVDLNNIDADKSYNRFVEGTSPNTIRSWVNNQYDEQGDRPANYYGGNLPTEQPESPSALDDAFNQLEAPEAPSEVTGGQPRVGQRTAFPPRQIGQPAGPFERTFMEPQEKEPTEEPDYMRTGRKYGGRPGIAVGGADPAVLDALGTALYAKKAPLIVPKELLQNSHDEHREIGQTEPIKVLARHDEPVPSNPSEAVKTIEVRDYGRGLAPDEMYTVLTDVGKSGKRQSTIASGGFGFAKAAPFLSGEYAKVISTVKEGGATVQYTFEGSPDQLKNQTKGVPLKREVVSSDIPTGLSVKTWFKKDADLYETRRIVRNMTERSSNLSSDVHYMDSYINDETSRSNYLDNVPLGQYGHSYYGHPEVYTQHPTPKLQGTVSTPGTDIGIHYNDPPPASQSSEYDIHVLNKGLYQFTRNGNYGDNVPNAPSDIIVNVDSKIEELKREYPFSLNREQLNDDTQAAIDKWINDNITAGHKQNKAQALARDYAAIAPLTPHTDVHFLDAGGKYTPDEIEELRDSPRFAQAQRIIKRVHDELMGLSDNLGWSDYNGLVKPTTRLEKFGFLFSEPTKGRGSVTLGVHIPNPAVPKKSTILINFMEHLNNAIAVSNITGDPPLDKLSTKLLATISHEIAHIPQRGHDTDFAYRHADMLGEIGRKNTDQLLYMLQTAVGDPTNGTIDPELLRLLDTYNQSRQRPSSTGDDLIRTGIHIEGPSYPRGPEGTDDTGVSGGSNLPTYTSGPRQPGQITTEPYEMPSEGGGGSGGKRDRSKPRPPRERVDPTPAIAELKKALEISSGMRESQEQMYTEERGARMREASKITTPGMKGFQMQKAKLAGALPKESPYSMLDKGTVDTLIDAITDSDRIGWWQKLNAKEGLVKILVGEEVPQRSEIALLGRVFGTDMVDMIELHAGIPIPFGQLRRGYVNYMGLSKSSMSSLDLSAPFRQGAGFVTYPEFWKTMGPMVKMFGSKDYYDGVMASISDDALYPLLNEAGLKLPDVDIYEGKEERFPSNFAQTGEGITPAGPLRDIYANTWGRQIRMSNQAYNGFLNKVRFDIAKGMLDEALNAGEIIQNPDGTPTKLLRDIAKVVNNGGGRGDLGAFNKVAGELNSVFFSPRMIASRIQTLNPVYYNNLEPMARKHAIRQALGIAGFGLLMTALYKMIGKETGKEPTINTNILDTDFMKSKWGNVRQDPWAGYQQYLVFLARFRAGQTQSGASGLTAPTRASITGNFVANKLDPTASLALMLASMRPTKSGEYVDRFGKQIDIPWEIKRRFIPMFIQDMNDLLKEDPSLAPLLVPTALGQSEQTFEATKPKSPFRMTIPRPSLGR